MRSELDVSNECISRVIFELLRESGASCNSFTFEPCNAVVKGNKNKQNTTLESSFNEDLMQMRKISKLPFMPG